MNQKSFFPIEDEPPAGSPLVSFKVTADVAYEAIMEALMKGSNPLHAIVGTTTGHGMTLSCCQIDSDDKTIRDVLKRANADFDRDSEIMRYEDEWNPHLNDSWW